MDFKPINRRKFLQLGGVTLGAALLGVSGLTTSCSTEMEPVEIDWIDTTYGESVMSSGKILVTYASASGSTVGVADVIGKKLAEAGNIVDVRPVKEVKDLKGYRAVVIGSAIHGGLWLPEAVKFVEDNKQTLKQMPTAFFLVCLMTLKNDEQSRSFVGDYLKDMRAEVSPVSEGRFKGAYLPEKYDFWTRISMKFFVGYLKIKAGDYRDWDAVNAWAEKTQPLLN
jgi:menaquinone-dependent protoporphyrinogen oxidase